MSDGAKKKKVKKAKTAETLAIKGSFTDVFKVIKKHKEAKKKP